MAEENPQPMAEENPQPMNNTQDYIFIEVPSTPISVIYKQFCKTPPECVKDAMELFVRVAVPPKLVGLNVHTMMIYYFHIWVALGMMAYKKREYAEEDRMVHGISTTRDEREEGADYANKIIMEQYSNNLRDFLREEGTLPMNEEKIEKLLSYNCRWWVRTKGVKWWVRVKKN